MARNRERQRVNRRRKYEQMLKKKDSCGVNDLTPFDAVKSIIISNRTRSYHLNHDTG